MNTHTLLCTFLGFVQVSLLYALRWTLGAKQSFQTMRKPTWLLWDTVEHGAFAYMGTVCLVSFGMENWGVFMFLFHIVVFPAIYIVWEVAFVAKRFIHSWRLIFILQIPLFTWWFSYALLAYGSMVAMCTLLPQLWFVGVFYFSFYHEDAHKGSAKKEGKKRKSNKVD